ncbi:hypothetical protein E2C01_007477 [Portunus trituberculatus]|uniref:Uncharacterized protein n=1 Tax=Portunus trituberculatus TaxID=210409 RepID=A0A5B7D2I7_PORTR|nr:hypothetical protein [Portunus trituberculatus]
MSMAASALPLFMYYPPKLMACSIMLFLTSTMSSGVAAAVAESPVFCSICRVRHGWLRLRPGMTWSRSVTRLGVTAS